MSRKLPVIQSASPPEFAEASAEPPDGLSRRSFLEYLGATIATASAAACAEPAKKIVPFSRMPPELTPGVPLHYATAMELDGYAIGLVAEAREGRPIKIEGNPDHPISLGATGPFEQASLLALYDDHRAQGILEGNVPRSWKEMLSALTKGLEDGAGLHVLMEPTGSRLIGELIAKVRARYPKAEFHFYSAFQPWGRWKATRALCGEVLMPQHRFEEAEVVLSLDDDFLTFGPTWLRDARAFAKKRRPSRPQDDMNRLYVAECGFTSTGAKADHRLPVHSRDLLRFAAAVARRIVRESALGPMLKGYEGAGDQEAFVEAVVQDLKRAGRKSVVLAGSRQPPAVHALALLMNDALGSIGRTVEYTEDPVLEAGEQSHELRRLVDALEEEQVERLVIAGGNPVYTAPADVNLGDLIKRVGESAYLGLYENETAHVCNWRIAESHYLESWDLVTAADGTESVVQPLIRPLFDGRTRGQLLAGLAGDVDVDSREIVRRRFLPKAGIEVATSLEDQPELRSGTEAEAEAAVSSVAPPDVPDSWLTDISTHPRFEAILRAGTVAGSASQVTTPKLDASSLRDLLPPKDGGEPGIELSLRHDPRVYDGRFSNIPWLLELPDPLTRLCWGNAALFGPATAKKLELDTGDLIRIAVDGHHVIAPVAVYPGYPDNTVSLALGYGRSGAEKNAAGVGVNAFSVRLEKSPWFARGAEIDRLDRSAEEVGLMPASVQHDWRLESETVEQRTVVLSRTLTEYRRDPSFAKEENEPPVSIHEPWPEVGQQWGMAIDTTACVGCNACVVACQAENNVPAVGKLNVEKGREMHWLRLDRYFEPQGDQTRVAFQPMLCQHCEKAPCEYVCPVNATVHSPDGLNEMVYNRCVGTRFCSNNCPYKVRRFNWFEFNGSPTPLDKLHYNPDVTVRAKGVMEKCTYCVQRIRRAGIVAKREGRSIEEEELKTACQQVCPADAIVFGDVADPSSRVSRLHRDRRAYAALHDTGTRPRTRYLALIDNPNPKLREDEGRASTRRSGKKEETE